MTGEMIFVFALIGVVGILMANNRVRFDIVAILVVAVIYVLLFGRRLLASENKDVASGNLQR